MHAILDNGLLIADGTLGWLIHLFKVATELLSRVVVKRSSKRANGEAVYQLDEIADGGTGETFSLVSHFLRRETLSQNHLFWMFWADGHAQVARRDRHLSSVEFV